MIVIGIDPGTEKSGWVEWNGSKILDAQIMPNQEILYNLQTTNKHGVTLALEWLESMGMRVGKEVFVTCRWVGRFHEAWGAEPVYIPRSQIKLHLCGQRRANDADIRQALIDRFGAPGTKKEPGATYGLKRDTWQTLAVCVTAFDNKERKT